MHGDYSIKVFSMGMRISKDLQRMYNHPQHSLTSSCSVAAAFGAPHPRASSTFVSMSSGKHFNRKCSASGNGTAGSSFCFVTSAVCLVMKRTCASTSTRQVLVRSFSAAALPRLSATSTRLAQHATTSTYTGSFQRRCGTWHMQQKHQIYLLLLPTLQGTSKLWRNTLYL